MNWFIVLLGFLGTDTEPSYALTGGLAYWFTRPTEIEEETHRHAN